MYFCHEWNKLNPEIRNTNSIYKFKKSIKIEILENSFYNVHDALGVKLLSRLKVQFSHLNEHKFRHGFNDTANPMCPCGTEIETNNIFSCVVIAFPARGLNSSIIFTMLILPFQNQITKRKLLICYMVQQVIRRL